ncbi:MAG: hypothetical protein Q7U16_02030 [Agitococcus sp.]|nr:hypothetical protein [Agitococcus sp.]
MQNRLNPYFHLVAEIALPSVAFTKDGTSYAVPCCFQIWEVRAKRRCIAQAIAPPPDFDFVPKSLATLAVRRTGRKAGMVRREFQTYATTSHYFLKAKIELEILVHRLSTLDFKSVRECTAGPFSVSKQELILAYIKKYPN